MKTLKHVATTFWHLEDEIVAALVGLSAAIPLFSLARRFDRLIPCSSLLCTLVIWLGIHRLCRAVKIWNLQRRVESPNADDCLCGHRQINTLPVPCPSEVLVQDSGNSAEVENSIDRQSVESQEKPPLTSLGHPRHIDQAIQWKSGRRRTSLSRVRMAGPRL